MREHKKSLSQKLRMDGRDYSRPGWYFVTMCADYHKMLFGRVEGVEMLPNELGQLVEQCWQEVPEHYPDIELYAWQLMPNHFHGLVRVVHGGKNLGEVLNMFKGSVTRKWRIQRAIPRHGEKKQRIWAPNYWDVICFQPEELAIKERYIRANPKRWALKSVPRGIIKKSRFLGNKDLLNSTAPRRALRVSRKTTQTELAALHTELASFEGLVCSTFFSPGEHACLEQLLKEKAQIIWILPMALPKHIPVVWTDALLEGRALWLSAFNAPEATRTTCQQANKWVNAFCNRSS